MAACPTYSFACFRKWCDIIIAYHGNQIDWNCPGRDKVKNESDRILNFFGWYWTACADGICATERECMVPL